MISRRHSLPVFFSAAALLCYLGVVITFAVIFGPAWSGWLFDLIAPAVLLVSAALGFKKRPASVFVIVAFAALGYISVKSGVLSGFSWAKLFGSGLTLVACVVGIIGAILLFKPLGLRIATYALCGVIVVRETYDLTSALIDPVGLLSRGPVDVIISILATTGAILLWTAIAMTVLKCFKK